MDDVCASRVLMMDNAGNRKEHQMVPRDDLIISMDRSQAVKEFVNHTEKRLGRKYFRTIRFN
jgi:hypothetical protein